MNMYNWIPEKFKEEKYIRFIKYVLSGTVTALIEIALFTTFYYLLLFGMSEAMRISLANFISRVIASYINYEINRRFVFSSEDKDKTYLIKFALLWVVQLEFSNLVIYFVKKYIGIEPWISKLLLDQILAVVSYNIQLRWVFKKREK
jgi:putative flippase GtrA